MVRRKLVDELVRLGPARRQRTRQQHGGFTDQHEAVHGFVGGLQVEQPAARTGGAASEADDAAYRLRNFIHIIGTQFGGQLAERREQRTYRITSMQRHGRGMATLVAESQHQENPVRSNAYFDLRTERCG